jgi:hypothetical protein
MNHQENILVLLKYVKINDQNIELLSKTQYLKEDITLLEFKEKVDKILDEINPSFKVKRITLYEKIFNEYFDLVGLFLFENNQKFKIFNEVSKIEGLNFIFICPLVQETSSNSVTQFNTLAITSSIDTLKIDENGDKSIENAIKDLISRELGENPPKIEDLTKWRRKAVRIIAYDLMMIQYAINFEYKRFFIFYFLFFKVIIIHR